MVKKYFSFIDVRNNLSSIHIYCAENLPLHSFSVTLSNGRKQSFPAAFALSSGRKQFVYNFLSWLVGASQTKLLWYINCWTRNHCRLTLDAKGRFSAQIRMKNSLLRTSMKKNIVRHLYRNNAISCMFESGRGEEESGRCMKSHFFHTSDVIYYFNLGKIQKKIFLQACFEKRMAAR